MNVDQRKASDMTHESTCDHSASVSANINTQEPAILICITKSSPDAYFKPTEDRRLSEIMDIGDSWDTDSVWCALELVDHAMLHSLLTLAQRLCDSVG